MAREKKQLAANIQERFPGSLLGAFFKAFAIGIGIGSAALQCTEVNSTSFLGSIHDCSASNDGHLARCEIMKNT